MFVYKIFAFCKSTKKMNSLINDNVYVAGCYNGSGISVGTLFGEQIALMTANQQSDEIKVIQDRKRSIWLLQNHF